MKKILLPVLFLMLLPAGSCKKDETPDTRGTVTINNTTTMGTSTYYIYGFLFSEGIKVTTQDNPPPDITVDSDETNILFMADNLKDSFYKAGEYNDDVSAITAFDNLTTANISENQWEGLATPLTGNQIWIYRSGTSHYAKMRIISVRTEPGDIKTFAECTFEWEYQPDGTLTFPGK